MIKSTKVTESPRDIMNQRGGTLILPWPNTPDNIRKVARDMRARGFHAVIEKHTHETYVWTDAPMSAR